MPDDRPATPGTRPRHRPRPLGGLAELADLLGGDSDRSKRFLGGLVVGRARRCRRRRRGVARAGDAARPRRSPPT